MKTVLAIDQSTSGTKALLFDGEGRLLGRQDLPHEQKVSSQGWVSHDPLEIYRNTLETVRMLLEETGADRASIGAVGISNQRETALLWDRDTGLPVADAVVWQCARATDICQRLTEKAEAIQERTGLHLSPYFPAAKWAWLLENTPGLTEKNLCVGTIDAWLVYKLTGGRVFATDYSNASRTQLFNLRTLSWDPELCGWFRLDPAMLPEVRCSDSLFGETDFEGLLPHPVPIHGVLGDSHGALLGQGCLSPRHGKGHLRHRFQCDDARRGKAGVFQERPSHLPGLGDGGQGGLRTGGQHQLHRRGDQVGGGGAGAACLLQRGRPGGPVRRP